MPASQPFTLFSTRQSVTSPRPVSAFQCATFSPHVAHSASTRRATSSWRLRCAFRSTLPTIRRTTATVEPVRQAILATDSPSPRSCRISSTGAESRIRTVSPNVLETRWNCALPVRLARRPEAPVQVRPGPGREVPRADQRPAARPHRHALRGAGGPFEELSRLDGTGTAVLREQVSAAGGAGGAVPRQPGRAERPDDAVEVRTHCALDDDGRGMLRSAMTDLGLSARAHDRILRVGRTIADQSRPPADHDRQLGRGDRLPDPRPQAVGGRSAVVRHADLLAHLQQRARRALRPHARCRRACRTAPAAR